MRWAGHVANGGVKGVYRVLVGKPEGRSPLGRSRRRWEDDMKMDLQAVGCGGGGGDGVEMVREGEREGELVNAVMNLRVP